MGLDADGHLLRLGHVSLRVPEHFRRNVKGRGFCPCLTTLCSVFLGGNGLEGEECLQLAAARDLVGSLGLASRPLPLLTLAGRNFCDSREQWKCGVSQHLEEGMLDAAFCVLGRVEEHVNQICSVQIRVTCLLARAGVAPKKPSMTQRTMSACLHRRTCLSRRAAPARLPNFISTFVSACELFVA